MKLYKTELKVQILSAAPYKVPGTLADVSYDIVDGECSGFWEVTEQNLVLEGEDARSACAEHGTDPEFFAGGD